MQKSRAAHASFTGFRHFERNGLERPAVKHEKCSALGMSLRPYPSVCSYVSYALAALRSFAKRDFLRLAVFLWINPFVAALSSFLIALTRAAFAVSSFCEPTAVSNDFTAVRSADFWDALRRRRFSFVFVRLMADLMFGITVTSYLNQLKSETCLY